MLLAGDSLDETLEQILALVFNNLPAQRGVICLYDEETDTSEPKVMRTRDGVPGDPIVISTHIANDVIKHKQSLLVRDAHQDDRYGSADSIIRLKIRTAMCAPLYREGRVAGFIYVDRQRPDRPFDTEHLQALSTIAVLSAVAVEQATLRDGIRHEQESRARLSRYSSPAVVERIVQAPGMAGRAMVAEEGEVSVLFADLTGFTSMAERMAPAEVVQVLNQVFERFTEAVFALDGTLDKFRGDGMMAFFGAPLQLHDHAERAVEAALRMQEMLEERNQYAPDARRLAMRIGINSGRGGGGRHRLAAAQGLHGDRRCGEHRQPPRVLRGQARPGGDRPRDPPAPGRGLPLPCARGGAPQRQAPGRPTLPGAGAQCGNHPGVRARLPPAALSRASAITASPWSDRLERPPGGIRSAPVWARASEPDPGSRFEPCGSRERGADPAAGRGRSRMPIG